MSPALWTAPTPNGWKVAIMLEELREAGAALPEVVVHTVDLARGGASIASNERLRSDV